MVRFPAGAKYFSFLHGVQTETGDHPDPDYPKSANVLTLGVKWQWRETDYSPPSSAEIKNVWGYIHGHQ
jgi:hypothetical protein